MEDNKKGCRFTCHVNRRFLPVKGFYFFFNAANACVYPYLVVYMKQQGLSASESGVLFGSMPFFSFLVQPLVGAAADRWLKHKAVLVTTTVLTALFHLLLLTVPSRTLAGNVLTSDANLTCLNDHYPVLSICSNRLTEFEALPLCGDDESVQPDCNVTQGKIKEDLQCPTSVFEVLGTFSNDNGSISSYSCRLQCNTSPHTYTNILDDVCLLPGSGEVSEEEQYQFPDKSCLVAGIHAVSSHGDSKQNHPFRSSGNIESQYQTTKISCFMFSITPVETKSSESLLCKSEATRRCTFRCQGQTDRTACGANHPQFDLTFGLFYIIFLAAFLTLAPMWPISDAITYALLKDQRHRYGRERVWGTVGFLVAAGATFLPMHFLAEPDGYRVDYNPLFYSCSALLAVSAAAAYFIDTSGSIRCGNMLKNARSLLTLPRVSVFLLVVFYFGMAFSATSFVFWFLADLGASPELFPLCVVSAVAAEVPIMAVSGHLVKRFGPISCICVAMVMMSIRHLGFSLLRNPWLVILIEPLHGLTFGLMFPASTAYISLISPPGMAATSQGLMAGVSGGLGRGAGALLTGWMFSAVGARVTFRIFSASGVVLLVVYALLYRLVFRDGTLSSTRGEQNVVEVKESNETAELDTHHPLMTSPDGLDTNRDTVLTPLGETNGTPDNALLSNGDQTVACMENLLPNNSTSRTHGSSDIDVDVVMDTVSTPEENS